MNVAKGGAAKISGDKRQQLRAGERQYSGELQLPRMMILRQTRANEDGPAIVAAFLESQQTNTPKRKTAPTTQRQRNESNATLACNVNCEKQQELPSKGKTASSNGSGE